MAVLVNRARENNSTSGTASFVLTGAVTGHQSFEDAGVTNGVTVTYVAESEDLTEWEVGRGVYTTADKTLTRATILASSDGGTKVSFSAAPEVFIDATADNLLHEGSSSKATPVDADRIGLLDSAANLVAKYVSWANVKVTLKAYFDTLYHIAGGTDVPVDDGGTGASTASGARSNLGLATVSQAEAEAGTSTTTRAWTAQRVAQAIAALASGFTAASQAEMEAGSSTSVGSTPGRQQYHPGHPKAWAHVHGGASPSLAASYNVTSITDSGVGDLTITIATDFSSANWSALCTTGADPGVAAPTFCGIDYNDNQAAGSVNFECHKDGGTAKDPQSWNFVGLGDQ